MTHRKHRSQGFAPQIRQLECRTLLASSATYVGLGTLDVAGPTAAVGPGGNRNLQVQLALPIGIHGETPRVQSLDIAGPTGFEWTYGTTDSGSGNPRANPAVAIRPGVGGSDLRSSLFDAYFSPVVSAVDPNTGATSTKTLPNDRALSITVAYSYAAGGPVTTDTATNNPALLVTPHDLDQTLTDPTPTLPSVSVGNYPGSFGSQTADGLGHIQIRGLPLGAKIVPGTAELSDVAGIYWDSGTAYGRPELGMTITQSAPGGTTADIAFPPRRDEANSTLTLRFQLDGTSPQWSVTDIPLGPSDHTDPNRRDGGPIDPGATPFVVAPTSTPNRVAYLDGQGVAQTIDIQALLDEGHKVVTLSAGTYTISKPLDINAGMILEGADPSVELDFNNLPASIPKGIINLNSSHITLDQFKVRFLDPKVDFIGEHSAIINDETLDKRSRVDLNILNLDIKAPATSFGVDPDNKLALTVATTFFDEFDSGTIQGNSIFGGTIQVQGGPWRISGNQVLGAVQGTLNLGAFAVQGGHDIELSNNSVTDVDPAHNGLIDRMFSANHNGYHFAITNNIVGTNVGVAAAVPDGSPAPGTSTDPRNNLEMILFEDYGKIFEGNVAAIGVGSSSSSGNNRRVISIPTRELDLFSGYYWAGRWALTVLNGPSAGTHLAVVQAFPNNTDPDNSYFLLDQSLPVGRYDLDIAPAYTKVDISQNQIDTSGTVSTGIVLVSTMVDATVTGNTFRGDRSAEYDGNHNLHQSQAIRVNPYQASVGNRFLHQDGTDESYNVLGVTIAGNIIVGAVGGVEMYLEVNHALSTTSGRTYGFVTLTNNHFRYSYPNSSVITLGNPGKYSRLINNRGVVPDASATNFTDPRTIRLTASGNTVEWTDGATSPPTNVLVNAAEVNGVLYEANATPTLLTDIASMVTVRVPLGSVFNTVGITTDDDPAAGSSSGFDSRSTEIPTGRTLSANALGSLGGTVSWVRQTFNIGTPGTKDVDSLGGVGITVPAGRYSTMLVLGASTNGDKAFQFTIFYTDGTSTPTRIQNVSDWAGNTAGAGITYSGESIASTMSEYNSTTGTNPGQTRYLYGYRFTLDPTRTVYAIGVSNDNNVKLLAIDLVRPSASATAPVVEDFGFEAVPVGSGFTGYVYNPSQSPWTFHQSPLGGSGLTGDNSAFTSGNSPAPEGGQVAFIQAQGAISESIDFPTSGTFLISFRASQRENFGISSEGLQVLVDGVSQGIFTPSGPTYSALSTGTFTLGAGSHTITFQGIDPSGSDSTVFIDDVRITAASAPAPQMVGIGTRLVVPSGDQSSTGGGLAGGMADRMIGPTPAAGGGQARPSVVAPSVPSPKGPVRFRSPVRSVNASNFKRGDDSCLPGSRITP